VAIDRYPFERHSEWYDDFDTKRRFTDVLETLGVDEVRSRLQEHNGGERSAITIGGCMMTKGYAQDWLAWHDRKREEAKEQGEAKHRTKSFRVQSTGVFIGFLSFLVAVGFLDWLTESHWLQSVWVNLTSSKIVFTPN
jgi:hypothetical protein